MKFTLTLLILSPIIAIIDAKRTYTTPSPFGSYHLKLFKCECNSQIVKYVYRNFSCYAKAINRDLSTANAYVVLKKDINRIWVSLSYLKTY